MNLNSHPRSWTLGLVLSPLLLAATGCEEPRHPEKRSQAAAPPPAAAPSPSRPRDVLGKTTQDIRAAEPEIQEKGAKVASTKIVAKDPITLPGNAYVTIIGRKAILDIQHALDLYKAENDRFPKDFQEFMDEVVKKNGVRLPTLPHYQEYGYDEKEHKLIILEYPDRKS